MRSSQWSTRLTANTSIDDNKEDLVAKLTANTSIDDNKEDLVAKLTHSGGGAVG
jgi:hypothetical protein